MAISIGYHPTPGRPPLKTPLPHADTILVAARTTDIQDNHPPRTAASVEWLHDVPLCCTVEFGRTTIRIRDLLALAVGSVLPVTKLAGEPVDIRANGNLIARGEVVLVNEHYGVRITEVPEGEG